MDKHTDTFTDYLMKYTKKELTAIARLHHMPRYSVFPKTELAEQLSSFLLYPATMAAFFPYLGKDELDIITSHSQIMDSSLTRRLREGGYCFKNQDGTFIVPNEVAENVFSNHSILNLQHKKSFFVDCLYAAGYLYGCAPISILLKMYNSPMDSSISREDFIKLFHEIPDYFNPFILKNDLCIHLSLYDRNLYQQIQKCQGTLPFYIPSKEDVIYLARYGYFPADSHDKRLAAVLKQLSDEDAYTICGNIQAVFRQGGTISDALTFLNQKYKITPPPSKDRPLLSALNEVFIHTRLLLNRGYTTAQTLRLKKKMTKIYPNSPCICGSGKKYKNCCGRRR